MSFLAAESFFKLPNPGRRKTHAKAYKLQHVGIIVKPHAENTYRTSSSDLRSQSENLKILWKNSGLKNK